MTLLILSAGNTNITGLSNAVYRKGAVDLITIWMLKISCHTISGVL
jgi:hypothetical protein